MTTVPDRLGAALADRYKLERELGQGGMATVYLAHDLKHDRQVAIKVLRPELAAVIGAERFLAEIKTTANLQHPHILPLFDSGIATGTGVGPEAESPNHPIAQYLFYVMPFIEGESLRDRLSREKQLPIADAVRIATEVASALDYAHRHHVIHRDIKPENVLLHDGRALVADFGIALAASKAGSARMTETGLSLGTPGYMSPEQATGDRQLDARSDVYSLGCLCYEMLAGAPPHTGPTVQAVIAAVVTKEPEPITGRRTTVPPHVAGAVHKALAKLPADRFENAAEFSRALGDPTFAFAASTYTLPGLTAASRAGRPALVIGVGAVALALGAVGGWLSHPRAPVEAAIRFFISGDSARKISGALALSPDGSRLVYTAETPAGRMLFQQRLAELEPRLIPGTTGVSGSVFFSPDGAWIAFENEKSLKKVSLDGSGLSTVTTFDGFFTGGSWGPDGSIIYSTYPDGHIYRVSAEGGPAQRIELRGVDSAEVLLAEPWFLPGGRTVLWNNLRNGQLTALSLPNELKPLGAGYTPKFLASGYLVFAQGEGSLAIQPFDPRKLELTGTPRRLVERVVTFESAIARYDATPGGTLAYLPVQSGAATLTLTARDGKGRPLAAGRAFWVPRFSPDGRRIAYGGYTTGGLADIWIYDLRLETAQRLTSGGDTGLDYNDPVWSPDGKRLALSALNGDAKDLYIMTSSGTAQPAELLKRPGEQWPSDWSPDGKYILFTDTPPNGKRAVWMVPVGGGEPTPLVKTAYHTAGGRVSPDGRWLAYDSDETGRTEVYIQPFQRLGPRARISQAGGAMPVWSHSGAELFYLSEGGLVAVQLRRGAEIEVERRQPLFEVSIPGGGALAQYDVHPDGLRFVASEVAKSADRIAVITNVLADSGR